MGWSTAYVARTIIDAQVNEWNSQSTIDNNAYAPGFIYKLISNDNNCYQPTSIDEALKVMVSQGVAKFRDLDADCPSGIPSRVYAKASLHRIKDYKRLFFLDSEAEQKIVSVKKSLSNGDPVVIGMRCTPSFEFADGKTLWKPKESPDTRDYFGHAMCVIGYDDKKYGGAFEIQNSWGRAWGDQGFIWVRYDDFANFAKYAYILEAYPAVFPTIVAPFNRRTTDSLKTPDAHLGAPYSLKNLFDLSAQIKLINQYEEEIQTKRNNHIYQAQPPVNEETEFKIFINNIRASYVYALKAESGKKIETLIQQSGNGENTFFEENQVISIPDGNNPIKLDQGTSKSYLCIFFSKNALNFPQLVSKMDKTKGDIVDKIDSVMGESLIYEEDISFLESEVGFSAFSRGKEMVALIIEMR
ncbi:MAG: C1 family peptidase [Bacteroidia bacterium]